MHGLEVGDVDFPRSIFDHVHDACGTEAVVPVRSDEVGVIPGMGLIVGSGDVTAIGVEGVREFLEGNETSPIVFICPAGDREAVRRPWRG